MMNTSLISSNRDGGNVIYVNTKKKLVISIAALFAPKAGDRIELIKKDIEPIFE